MDDAAMRIIIEEIVKEYAAYYRKKITASGIDATRENVKAAIKENWDAISKHIKWTVHMAN